MSDEFKKDDRPGPVRVLAAGSSIKTGFRSLRLASDAAGLTDVTVISGGAFVVLPLLPGEQIPVTGTEITSTLPTEKIIYWTI